jgi:serine/threonine protein kinase
LFQTKQASHDNLNTFVGLTHNNIKNEFLLLWKLCTRGSLQDIIANDDLKLDMDFKASFINDIIKVFTVWRYFDWYILRITFQGMLFLHGSEVKEHGALRSSNCLVDNHWTVKLTDFGINRTITDLFKHRDIQYTEDGVQEPTSYSKQISAPKSLFCI